MGIEQHYRAQAWEHYQSSAETARVEAARVSRWIWVLVGCVSVSLLGLVGLMTMRLPRFESVVVECSNATWAGLEEPMGVWNPETLVALPVSAQLAGSVASSRIVSDVRATCVTKQVSSVTVRILRHPGKS